MDILAAAIPCTLLSSINLREVVLYMRIVRCVPVIGRTVRTKQLSSETLVVPALLVEVLHARDDVRERGEPLVELLVELVGRN